MQILPGSNKNWIQNEEKNEDNDETEASISEMSVSIGSIFVCTVEHDWVAQVSLTGS
jgi:hypothetical protein